MFGSKIVKFEGYKSIERENPTMDERQKVIDDSRIKALANGSLRHVDHETGLSKASVSYWAISRNGGTLVTRQQARVELGVEHSHVPIQHRDPANTDPVTNYGVGHTSPVQIEKSRDIMIGLLTSENMTTEEQNKALRHVAIPVEAKLA